MIWIDQQTKSELNNIFFLSAAPTFRFTAVEEGFLWLCKKQLIPAEWSSLLPGRDEEPLWRNGMEVMRGGRAPTKSLMNKLKARLWSRLGEIDRALPHRSARRDEFDLHHPPMNIAAATLGFFKPFQPPSSAYLGSSSVMMPLGSASTLFPQNLSLG